MQVKTEAKAKVMGFKEFYTKAKIERYNGKEFWQTQYSLFIAGCRDARMHDFTLVNLS